MQINQKMLGE